MNASAPPVLSDRRRWRVRSVGRSVGRWDLAGLLEGVALGHLGIAGRFTVLGLGEDLALLVQGIGLGDLGVTEG